MDPEEECPRRLRITQDNIQGDLHSRYCVVPLDPENGHANWCLSHCVQAGIHSHIPAWEAVTEKQTPHVYSWASGTPERLG